jgi:hypothetical protein
MIRKHYAGWLLLSLLPLFVYVGMTLSQHQAAEVASSVDVDQVSAELARSMSYGFVEQPAQAVPTSVVVQPLHTARVVARRNALASGNTGL